MTTNNAKMVKIVVSNGFGCKEKLKAFSFTYDAAAKTWSRECLLDGDKLMRTDGGNWTTMTSLVDSLRCYDKARKFVVDVVEMDAATICG